MSCVNLSELFGVPGEWNYASHTCFTLRLFVWEPMSHLVSYAMLTRPCFFVFSFFFQTEPPCIGRCNNDCILTGT